MTPYLLASFTSCVHKSYYLYPHAAVNITLEQEVYEIPEDGGSLDICAILSDGVLERNVIVSLSTANGTAFGELTSVHGVWMIIRFQLNCFILSLYIPPCRD